MATYQISGPGGAVYQIEGPEGADPSALVGAINGQSTKAPSPNAPQGALGEVALAGRDVGEGVLDTLAAPHDLSTAITNWARPGINRLLGTHLPQVTPFSAGLSNALTSAGAPVASTPGEKLAASAIQGTAGALTGLGAMGLPARAIASLPALRAALAGTTGGTSAGVARQAGVGPVGQFAAGLAGGLMPAGIEGTLAAGSRLADPFTRAGQARIAGNALSQAAENPSAAAQNLLSAQPLVPGSMRTAGEASGDTGLLALEKGIRARNPGPFGTRISEQNAARQAELTNVGGTPADITAAQTARDATTAPMRQAAFTHPNNAVPAPVADVHSTIDSILASPSGARETIAKTMNWARGLIGDNTDPETLYEVRKDLRLAQQGKLQPSSEGAPAASTLAHARGQLGQVINSLDDAIESSAPGYKAYLARYADMSEPIDQMGAIQELQQKASSGLDTATGHPFLSAPSFSRGLASTLDQGRLTPTQTARLNAMREDLQRGSALSSPTVKTPGSDTFQNFMLGRKITGGLTGHVPLIGKYLRGVNDFVDQRVNQELTNAMLNPQHAASLLGRATPTSPFVHAMGIALRNRALPIASAPLPALSSSQSLRARLPGLLAR